MSKTRRQRALDHPGKPKKGVRDPRRKNRAAATLGKLGGLAPHKLRGLQAASSDTRKQVAEASKVARAKAKLAKVVDEVS